MIFPHQALHRDQYSIHHCMVAHNRISQKGLEAKLKLKPTIELVSRLVFKLGSKRTLKRTGS